MAKDVSRIKVVTIDVDGCLVSYDNVGTTFRSSWDALGCAYGLQDKWNRRTEKFYDSLRGTNDHSWAETNVAELAGKSVQEALKILYPIPYCAGAREFADASKGKFTRGLLTTAIDLVAKKAEEELGFDFCMCNTLHRNNGTFAGTLDYDVPTWLKHTKLLRICGKYFVKPKEICHIGDNENDVDVAEKVGMFIALKPKTPKVEKKGDYVVNDFFEVGRILGVLK